MSVLITTTTNGVRMAADTQETSFASGGSRILSAGKIFKTHTTGGDEVLIGVVGSADHFGLLKFLTGKVPPTGSSYDELFLFFAQFYDEASNRSVQVMGDEGGTYSEFHVAFADSAWLVRGLTIEPIQSAAASGSGADLAFGALAADATLEEALSIACRNNVFCAFPIDIWEVENGKFTHKRVDEDLNAVSHQGDVRPPLTLARVAARGHTPMEI